MMMNFRDTGLYAGISKTRLAAIVLLLFMTQLNAEVVVNNIKKNDKVTGSALSEQNVLTEAADIDSVRIKKTWKLYAEQWEISRSGASILSVPVLNQVINAWLQDREKMIEIQYPGGEEGEFWVQELSDWLVSLGIPSQHMALVPGSGADYVIKFALIQ